MYIRAARLSEDPAICAIAKASRFTRDFASILFIRQSIESYYAKGEVGVALASPRSRKPLGFICVKHLVRKPHSSIYYMGVAPEAMGKGVGKALVKWALSKSPWGKLELVCEDGNAEAQKFYRALGFKEIGTGTVGKAQRPYTRFELKPEL